jgi:membrane protease YdiL (CAAX protease family)
MDTFVTIKQLGLSFLSFSILCAIVHFLAKILKIKYNGFKFSTPKKSAFYAIITMTISSCMVTGLMFLLKSQNTSEVSSNIQKYNLSIVINFAISWLILLSPILIVKKIRNESWESTGISKHNLKASILIGTVLAIITIASVILFSSKSLSDIRHNLTLNSLWALVYFAIVGFCEEFMFRGYLQIRLMGWLGRWKGWILTSTFMALIHIPQRMASMGLSPKEAILSSCLLIPISLTMGYILIKTENIAAPAIYHTFANWVSVLM